MIIYHYTTQKAINSILSNTFLHPALGGVIPPEKPAVWFSSNPKWEPTANKSILTPDGHTRLLTTKDMFELIPLYRFGIDSREALPWAQLVRKARISRKMQRFLIEVGRQRGARPTDWYGILTLVPIDNLVFEAWRENQWCPQSLSTGNPSAPI